MLRPGGHQVLANVYRVVELGRGYEQTGAISFRGLSSTGQPRAPYPDAGGEERQEGVP